MDNMNNYQFLNTIAYGLEPSDGTRYTFSISKFPDNYLSLEQTVFLGVGKNPKDNYFFLSISMSGGSGCGIVPIAHLMTDDLKDVASCALYARGHGFEKVNLYTLVAVLLACKYLLDPVISIELACKEMLKAPEVLALIS